MNVAVVGGGLAGLTAAHRLVLAGARVSVFEAGTRWGGQILTERSGRFVVEQGAEGYAAARTSVRELCTRLGLAGRLVSQLTSRTLVLRNGVMQPAPVEQAARLAGIQVDRPDAGHGLASLEGGMGELVDALVAALRGRAVLRLQTPVARLTREASGWSLTTGTGETFPASAVLVAVPAAAAAALLERPSATAAKLVGSLATVSNVSVSLALGRSAVAHPLDASGFVVPGGIDAQGLRACTFVSSKFPRRAPRGRVLLRAFFRPGDTLPITAPERDWVDLAVAALWPALGVAGAPSRSWVARWPDAIPRYADDHAERLAGVRAVLEAEAPALELAGAAYGGAGVAGAIESAEDAADRLFGPGPGDGVTATGGATSLE